MGIEKISPGGRLSYHGKGGSPNFHERGLLMRKNYRESATGDEIAGRETGDYVDRVDIRRILFSSDVNENLRTEVPDETDTGQN